MEKAERIEVSIAVCDDEAPEEPARESVMDACKAEEDPEEESSDDKDMTVGEMMKRMMKARYDKCMGARRWPT